MSGMPKKPMRWTPARITKRLSGVRMAGSSLSHGDYLFANMASCVEVFPDGSISAPDHLGADDVRQTFARARNRYSIIIVSVRRGYTTVTRWVDDPSRLRATNASIDDARIAEMAEHQKLTGQIR